MATIRLVPSTYAFSNSTTMSISDVDNMYNNTSNETYATVTTTQNNTSKYYIYLRGFNFNSVPSNAVVSSFTVKIKARETRLYTSTNASTNYRMGLYNNTTPLTNAYTGNLPSTTVQTITISHGDYSWGDIKGYASNFGIRVCLRRSDRNNQGYMYIYGAEIEVNYTVPIYYNVSFNNISQSVTTVPSATKSIMEGGDQTIVFYGFDSLDSVVVEDNGVDVTSNLVPTTNMTTTFNPSSPEDYSGYSIDGQENGCTNTNSTTYCSLGLRQQTNAYVLYSFDTSTIPLGATINSVSCSAKVSVSTGSTSITDKLVQLYAGSTAKGTPYTNITTSTTVFNITAGNNWTVEEVRDIKIKAGASYPNTNYYELRFYGADLTINYTVNETFYVYTISNIQADHVISVSDKQTGSSLYWKNGSWSQYTKIYKKTNNSWVQQTISLDLFDGNKIIVSG